MIVDTETILINKNWFDWLEEMYYNDISTFGREMRFDSLSLVTGYKENSSKID